MNAKIELVIGGKRAKLPTALGVLFRMCPWRGHKIVSLSASGGLAPWRFNGFFGSWLIERHQQLRMGYGLSERCGEAHQSTARVRGITLGMRGTTQRQFNSAGVADRLRWMLRILPGLR